MSIRDLLNWDFLMPRYTNKQKEDILKELQKKRQQKKEEEGDMMMVYTTINEVISRIETINEIEEEEER